MTNVQKAFCILLSMCFFATLAVLPGTFFTGENVYRHLPLYRFLEKRAHMSSCEDIETYKKIAGENGKYLGERAQSEQLLAEKGESEESIRKTKEFKAILSEKLVFKDAYDELFPEIVELLA